MTARRFRKCVIAVRPNPVTIEIRRTPVAMRAALLRSFATDVGFGGAVDLVPCLLVTDELRNQLQQLMHATPHGEKRVGRGQGLGTWAITTDGSISLFEQIDWLGSQAAHHEVFMRSWAFQARHADGYLETARYYITVGTGDMRVSDRISEVALNNLRNNVLSLF